MTFYISPYRRMSSLRKAMDRMFEDSLNESAPTEREMMLAVDVQAGDDAYAITALVPGLEADDLEIEILNNTVTIRGEFKSCAGEEAKYLVCELPSGQFGRVITLPTAVDASKVEATIKNGVLNLQVPKAEAHRPKAIKVVTG
ncbi:MAG: Hsp20/alpha crystallin family protein [Anaerolineales bacterium]|nr:Hsp20/alpha crystallin family protein [Anaerolineales bacterium]